MSLVPYLSRLEKNPVCNTQGLRQTASNPSCSVIQWIETLSLSVSDANDAILFETASISIQHVHSTGVGIITQLPH